VVVSLLKLKVNHTMVTQDVGCLLQYCFCQLDISFKHVTGGIKQLPQQGHTSNDSYWHLLSVFFTCFSKRLLHTSG